MPTHPGSWAGYRTPRAGIVRAAAAAIAGGAGQSFGCRVANTSSSRELFDVAITIRRSDGSTAAMTTCPSLAPLTVCGIASAITPGPGRVWCEVTAIGSERSMRVTLSNDVTGASADGS